MFRREAVVPVLAVMTLLLTSCAPHAGDPVTESTPQPVISPTETEAPQAFLEREPLASCGEFTLEQGEQNPAGAMECLNAAIGAGGAELVVTGPTVEGDPIITWYRALPTGGMETWSDVRRDKFAGEGVSWHYRLCPTADALLGDPGECTYESFTEQSG